MVNTFPQQALTLNPQRTVYVYKGSNKGIAKAYE